MPDTVLVADIGGTNARFALAEYAAGDVTLRDEQRYRTKDYECVLSAAEAYLQTVSQRPLTACFAVAGPVMGNVITFTNSPWVLDVSKTMAAMSLKRLEVVNDFEALAYGVKRLQPEDTIAVKAGAPDKNAPVLVIGPGTGFGQALIVPCKEGDRIVATEGGHVAFAPQTGEGFAVREFIAREQGRVSIERLLSGQGIVDIHRALCSIHDVDAIPLKAQDITIAAEGNEDRIARKTVELFCEILGAAAGDAVLATGARGGVVLGGGILPKIRKVFLASRFVEHFCDKGRRRNYLEAPPVDMIVSEDAALIGAGVVLGQRAFER